MHVIRETLKPNWDVSMLMSTAGSGLAVCVTGLAKLWRLPDEGELVIVGLAGGGLPIPDNAYRVAMIWQNDDGNRWVALELSDGVTEDFELGLVAYSLLNALFMESDTVHIWIEPAP